MAKQKITGQITDSLDDKRCYLPLVIKTKCQTCKEELVRDFNDDYLSYPDLSKPVEVGFYCENCESEYYFNVDLKITATMEFDLEKLKKFKE